jgi:hypothetical protein
LARRTRLVLARRVQPGMTMVRRPAEPERVVNTLDPIIDMWPIERPHLDGMAVAVYTERFPDGLHFGRRGQVRVLDES